MSSDFYLSDKFFEVADKLKEIKGQIEEKRKNLKAVYDKYAAEIAVLNKQATDLWASVVAEGKADETKASDSKKEAKPNELLVE